MNKKKLEQSNLIIIRGMRTNAMVRKERREYLGVWGLDAFQSSDTAVAFWSQRKDSISRFQKNTGQCTKRINYLWNQECNNQSCLPEASRGPHFFRPAIQSAPPMLWFVLLGVLFVFVLLWTPFSIGFSKIIMTFFLVFQSSTHVNVFQSLVGLYMCAPLNLHFCQRPWYVHGIKLNCF